MRKGQGEDMETETAIHRAVDRIMDFVDYREAAINQRPATSNSLVFFLSVRRVR